ncbi:MAG: T9SS type A sorting domain-containing protein [Bacteroidetes bacterium]|nr:T9SS type A sorting domain-containing protein [Bacteroidota bacterium]
MKKFNQNCCLFSFVIVSFFTISGFGQFDWQRMEPVPQENAINDFAKILGTDKIIAVCENATYMISDNYGQSWEVYTNPGSATNSYDLVSVYFDDIGEGLMTGSHFSIFESIDEGLTWELSYFDPQTNINNTFNDLLKLIDGSAIAIGTNGKIMRRGGSGQDWIEMNSGVDFTLNAIAKTNNTIYAIGNGDNVIVKSTDNGVNWATQTLAAAITGHMHDIHFISDDEGIITLSSSGTHQVLKTYNGGVTWQIVWSGYSYFPYKIDFFDDMHGMVSCGRNMYESGILITTDGGDTWNEVEMGQFSWNDERAIIMTAYDEAIMAGHLGLIFKAFNFGENWELITHRSFMGDIFSMQFTDENTGYALASNYTGGLSAHDLLKTTNGGLTWETVGWGETYSEAAMHFINNQTGIYAVRDFDLTIYKTIDGGDNWDQVESGTWDFHPMSINFYNELLGFICGTNDIIRTQDGGDTWELVYDGVFTDDHWDIQFLSENDILVSGSFIMQTYILKSADGGDTWEYLMPDNYGHGFDLEFINADTGFMACENSMILKTLDGGENWQPTFVTASDWTPIYKVSFVDNNTGYAVAEGDYETLLKTTDQGETWNPVDVPATSGLLDLHFFNTQKGMVVGRNGLVMKTGEFLELNPPENLQLEQEYIYPPGWNIMTLSWDAPSTANTPDLEGYNIYMCDEFEKFVPYNGNASQGYVDTIPPSGPPPGCWNVCYYITAVYSNPQGESGGSNVECGWYLTDVEDNSFEGSIISCQPNPFSDKTTIQLSSDLKEHKTLILFDQHGRIMKSVKVEPNLLEILIDGIDLQPGVYFYQVRTQSGFSESHKLIKL